MKKYILFLVTIVSLSSFAQVNRGPDYDTLEGGAESANTPIVTYTSEPCGLTGKEGVLVSGSPDNQTARYRCTVKGANGFIDMIGEIYRYVFFVALILGVLYIVGTGLAISLSGAFNTEEMKDAAKKKALDVFGGLMALALVPWILKTVAPFFFK